MLGYSAGFIKSDTSATLNYFLDVERHGDSMPFVNFLLLLMTNRAIVGFYLTVRAGGFWVALFCMILAAVFSAG